MIGSPSGRCVADAALPSTNITTTTNHAAMASPSLRQVRDDSDRTNHSSNDNNTASSTTVVASSEQKLFSPRSTAAMALSSISAQVFTRPSGVAPMMRSIVSASQQPQQPPQQQRTDVSTMTQQLLPPQSLFQKGPDVSSDHPLPFIPHLTSSNPPHLSSGGDSKTAPPNHAESPALPSYERPMLMAYTTPLPPQPPPPPPTPVMMIMTANHPMMMMSGVSGGGGTHHHHRHAHHSPATGGDTHPVWTTPYHHHQQHQQHPSQYHQGTPQYHQGTPSMDGRRHQHHHLPSAADHHSTPYPIIHRCSSYGSASSSQPPPPPPPHHLTEHPPPLVATSTTPYEVNKPNGAAAYHPRSVSWSHHEPVQWIPYCGPPPPQFMPVVSRPQPPYYPTPTLVHPHPHVTPTPHKKKAKIGHRGNSAIPLSKASRTATPASESRSPLEGNNHHPPITTSADHSMGPEEEEDPHQHQQTPTIKYSRKNKSLGILAESFLNHFTAQRDEDGNDLCQEIMVDRLSTQLNVERRRIYDVVNILEALQVIVKIGKNTYHWMGRKHLPNQFALLQNDAIDAWPAYAAKVGFCPVSPPDRTPEGRGAETTTPPVIVTANWMDNNELSSKSLTRLSHLFLQVFLVSGVPLSLPQASDLIHGGRSSNDELLALGMKEGDAYPTDERRLQQIVARGLKTKIRRLYDIANVFLSVGLLRKCENRCLLTSDGKRPQYCLNYHLSIHEIRSLYKTLPKNMIESKTPFTDEQLLKLKRSGQTKVQYFGLSEQPCEINNDPTKKRDAESLSESSPPMTKSTQSVESLVQSDLDNHAAIQSRPPSTHPATTIQSDSPCYVKEAVTPLSHSSLTNELSNVGNIETTTCTLAVESPLNTSSSTTTLSPSSSSSLMNVSDDANMKMDDTGGHLVDETEHDDNPVDSSPSNSSASIDINNMIMATASSSCSPSSTTSVLSPRRVSLEK